MKKASMVVLFVSSSRADSGVESLSINVTEREYCLPIGTSPRETP